MVVTVKSAMLLCVVLVRTDVLEECIAAYFSC
jgi:hypothetical protein